MSNPFGDEEETAFCAGEDCNNPFCSNPFCSQEGNVECTPQSCGRPEPESEPECQVIEERAQVSSSTARFRSLFPDFRDPTTFQFGTPDPRRQYDSRTDPDVIDDFPCPGEEKNLSQFGQAYTVQPMYSEIHDFTRRPDVWGSPNADPNWEPFQHPDPDNLDTCTKCSLWCSLHNPCACRRCCPNQFDYLQELRLPRDRDPTHPAYWDRKYSFDDHRYMVLQVPQREHKRPKWNECNIM